MKFLSLEIEYENKKKVFKFSNKTLIFSEENSVGKSTILRLLFYGVGYPVPGTYGIKFKSVKSKVRFWRNDSEYTIIRIGNYVEIYKEDKFIDSRYLDGQDDSWFSYIWGIDAIHVLRNILGAIYMDQDKGWTLLNRGKVIGNIRFNVQDLLIGLSSKENDLESLLSEVDVQRKMLKETRQLIQLGQTSLSYKNEDINSLREVKDVEMNKEYKNLKIKLRYNKQQLSKVKRNIADEQGLLKFILSLSLMVQVGDDEVVITKNNLMNFENNFDYLRQRAASFDEKIEEIQFKISKLEQELKNKTSNLFEDEIDVVTRTLNDISKIDIDIGVLESRESELSSSIVKLNNKIEAEFMEKNDLIEETMRWITIFAKSLKVLNVIKDKKFVFTRDLKTISGTVFYKVVFSFKMAYIKMIEEYTGVCLPIVLDSPSGREVTKRNIGAVINILNEYFSKNQIIITSINRYDLNDVHEIKIKEKIFEN